jgi:curli biogenesis system outer membrane secretion channel CsgG
MRCGVIAGVLAASLMFPFAVWAQTSGAVRKPVVSINDIQDLANTGQSAQLRQMIETTIVNTGKFRIMERGDQGTAVLLREQQGAKAGLYTSNTPGKIGGFEGVDFMVYGTITTGQAATEHNTGASMGMIFGGGVADRFGIPGLGTAMRANSNCNTSSASLAVDIRITDGRTGEERYAKHVTQTEQGQTVCGGRSSLDVSGLLRAAAQSVSMGLVTIMYPVKVVDIDGDGQILLNYGEGLLGQGDVFALFQEGRQIVDPDTGAVLGNSEKYLGLVQITEVMPKMSKAKMVTAFAVSPVVGTVARAATPEQLAAAAKHR